jgi:3-hydroxyisobutyrate dehydrogenase-like beta-hydroxyacid dehydrogenase
MNLQDIGLIGLAVMGQNLVLNMERNGFSVAVYNRTAPRNRGTAPILFGIDIADRYLMLNYLI